MKKIWISASIVVGLSLSAWAVGTFIKVFDSTYNIQKGSSLGKAKCMVCHSEPNGKKMNPYGSDLKAAMKAANTKKLTVEVLKSVENLDSNGDGVKNIDEIKADKLPGKK
jgi:hypothetical protein